MSFIKYESESKVNSFDVKEKEIKIIVWKNYENRAIYKQTIQY
jgi:hypothetical protein